METHQYVAATGVNTAREAQATAAAATAFANAQVVRPYLSHSQASLLVELFSPLQLVFEPAVSWSHPVQRVIHNFLEAYVRRKAGACLEVGAHPRSINEHANVIHRCFLPPDGRDMQRWRDCPRRGPANNIRRCILTGRPATDLSFCTNGFQRCRHYADVGIALYSLHDLHPREVARAMRAHGMHTLYAVMHLPAEALLPDGVYTTRAYTARNLEGRLIVTYEGDTSAGYNHDRKSIRSWIKATRVRGCCALVIERVRAVGCHFVLRLTTVTNPCPMPYTPYPKATTIYVRSLFSAGTQAGPLGPPPLMCEKSRSTFHCVPTDIWDRLMLFGATLDDEAFCCSRLMTYLRGISFKVTVGTVVANEGWTTDEYALTAVVVASYLTICHQRWIRTQGISMGIRRLAKEHQQGLLFRLGEWLLAKICGPRETFVPGRQLQFYRQCRDWVSAGFYIDLRELCFDREYACPCLPLERVIRKGCNCAARKLKQVCGCFMADAVESLEDSVEDLTADFYPEPDVFVPQGLDNWTIRALTDCLFKAGDRALRAGTKLAGWPRIGLAFFLSPVGLVFSGEPVPGPPGRRTERGPFWGDAAPSPPLPDEDYPYHTPVSPDGPPPPASWTPGPISPRYIPPTPVEYRGHRPGSAGFWEATPSPSPDEPLSRHSSLQSVDLVPLRNPPVAPVQRVLLELLPDGAAVYEGDLFGSSCYWLVNAANPQHAPGGGICGVFFKRYPEAFDRTQFVHPNGARAAYTVTPRPIIHAVAPDYRVRRDPAALQTAYQECLYRQERAAYCLLGSGIYQVPPQESMRAWLDNHLPGDEMYILPSMSSWYRSWRAGAGVGREGGPSESEPGASPEGTPPRGPASTPSDSTPTGSRDAPSAAKSAPAQILVITPNLANTANLALQQEAEGPFAKFIGNAHVPPGPVRYRFVAGVPGSGKSVGVCKQDCDLVIVPTNQLKAQWRARGFPVMTPHVGLQHCQGKRLVVDEAPSLPPHLLLCYMTAAADVLLLGDPRQIPAIDFESKGLIPAMQLNLEPTEWRLQSHRCPRDVCYLLSADYPGMSTTNPIVRSLMFTGDSAGQVLVFTQAAKAMHPGSITVHEAQGSTFNTTTIVVTNDARGLLASSRAHCIVALTRHTDKCYILDGPGLLKELGVTDSILNNFYLTQPVEVQARPAAVERAEKCENLQDIDMVPPAPPDVALHQMAEAFGHRPLEVRAVVPLCPPLEQGKLYTPFNLAGRDQVTVLALSPTVHCRMAAPAHRLAVLSTLVGRYGKETKLWHDDVEVMRESLRALVPSISGVRVTSCELMELVEAMIARGQDGTAVLDLDFSDKACTRITFFQKDCNKFTTDEPVQHGKVGQGISAWSKTLVALFGPWFRAIEKAIVANLPEWCFYGDCYVQEKFEAAVAGAKACRVFENDFSEFDSTQNNYSLGLECLLMREAGAPEWLWRLYHLLRSAWVLQAPQESLRGRWKKHSGEPGTLLWNTVWNMAVILHCYQFDGLAVAAFKGDDSVVCCRFYQQRPQAAALITGCGLKLKVNFGDVGSYAGLLVACGLGVTPDVVRFLGRISEKNWGPVKERREDLEQAVRDFVAKLKNVTALSCLLATRFYKLEPGLALNAVAGLKAIAEGRMELKEYTWPVLQLEGKKE
uniref:Non-structural polyprotein n=2 Tax=Hepatitis E virus TaxID=1678143 RepID=W0TXZ6_HEV|nr:non-structural polyprotein [Paslahepevirus balayani]